MQIITAWQCISPQNAVDGTDDNTLWNGIKGDGNVRNECEENERH